jgi:hypothetical protein
MMSNVVKAPVHVRLQPEHVRPVFCIQFRRHRFEFVEPAQRDQGEPAERLVGRCGLQVVQIHVAGGRHHHVVARAGRLDAAFGASP